MFKNKLQFWDLTKVKIKDINIEIAEKLKTDESESKCWEKDLENMLLKKNTLNVYEKREKSTKYFFNLEKKHGQERLW